MKNSAANLHCPKSNFRPDGAKNYFWFQFWLQILTMCSQFADITSIYTVEKQLLAHTSENRAKTAVCRPLEAKQEVEIWRQPKKIDFLTLVSYLTPNTFGGLSRTVTEF